MVLLRLLLGRLPILGTEIDVEGRADHVAALCLVTALEASPVGWGGPSMRRTDRDRDYYAIKIVLAAGLSKWDRARSRYLHPDSYWLELAEEALKWSAPAIRAQERERLGVGDEA
jgi:hypothetical protein